jgi:hypothetical protein
VDTARRERKGAGMTIDVRIERLVLDGIDLPPEKRPLLQAAVEGELARMLAAGGLSADLIPGGARPRVPGGEIRLSGGDDAGDLGVRIARAVYGGIGR